MGIFKQVFIVVVLSLSVSQSAFSETPKGWDQLIEKALKMGEKSTSIDGYFLKRATSFDRSKNRTVQYLTLRTQITVDGQESPTEINLIKERWTQIKPGNWKVEQQIRIISLEAKVLDASNRVLYFEGEGIVKDIKYLSPKKLQKASLQKEVNMWNRLILLP